MGMRRFAAVFAGSLSIAAFCGAAQGADLGARTYTKAPPVAAPVYDWTGFYIGLNGGGASSHQCLTIFSVAGAPVTPNSEGCHDATGGLVGGQQQRDVSGVQHRGHAQRYHQPGRGHGSRPTELPLRRADRREVANSRLSVLPDRPEPL